MCSHENTGATFFGRALTSQSVDFTIVVHTVVFQNCQLDLLVLMLDLFGCSVILLLTFLTTTTQTEDQMKGRLCRNRGKKLVKTRVKIEIIIAQHKTTATGCASQLFSIHVKIMNKLPFWML